MTQITDAEARLNTLMPKAKALLDAVTFDDSGAMVAGKWVGGNGGLISRETMKAADELRQAMLEVGK